MRISLTPLLPFFLLFTTILAAQKTDMQVTRCSAVDRARPVSNIFVDSDNTKWVANNRGIFQVRACDVVTPLALEAGEQSAFGFPFGNADGRWTSEALRTLVKEEIAISAALYDAKRDMLLLGTEANGLYQFKTNPQLQLTEHYTDSNSKLKSNAITSLFQDKSGRFWVGSEEGLMVGAPGKWKTDLDGYAVQRVREMGADLYVLADGEFWIVQGGEKWKAITIDEKCLEREPVDFDIDPEGRLWILSGIIARYDLNTDAFEIFGAPEYYTSEFGNCIAADRDGAIWVGTDDKGLFLIEKSSAFTANCLIDKELNCNGNGKDGALRMKISGGKEPYTYQWSAAGLSGDNPQNLSAGNYTVTVTDSNGKTKIAKATLLNTKITLAAQQKKAESGPGRKDGVAEAVVGGGDEPFRFQWDNGETTNPAQKLPEGNHTVTVTDKNGCTATASVAIVQKIEALSGLILELEKIKCNGGKTGLKASVNGGKAPFQYQWSNPMLSGEQTAAVPAGDYQLTITDAAGNKATASFSVKQPEPLTASIKIQSPASVGNADGKATVQVNGGTETYSFRWDNSETAAAATKLGPGKRSVTVTDANGCTATAQADITENILPLSALIETLEPIKCNGGKGSLKASASGGKAPFQFQWNNPALSGEQLTGVAAGEYQLTVTDASGKKANATFNFREPELLIAFASVQTPASVGDANGKASAQAKGGNGNYTFAWDNGETTATASKLTAGDHNLTVTDAKGCQVFFGLKVNENILPLTVTLEESGKIKCAGDKINLKATVNGGKGPFQFLWNNPTTSGDQPTVTAGEYLLTVTDASGGKTNTSINIKQPQPVVVNATVKASASIGNADGKAIVQALGGVGKYIYAWDNGETTATASKLAPGKHLVTVTDANGCANTADVEITENILPLALTLAETGKIKCAGEKSGLIATIAGGRIPYQIQWNNPALSGEQADNLEPGDYKITVTDAKGASQSATLSIKSPEALSAELLRTVGATTERSRDGKATVQVKGGTAPLTYAWDNGETTLKPTKLTFGAHQFTVTDANGCSQTLSADIRKRILPELTAGVLQSGQTIRMEQLRFEADSTRLNDDCLPVLNELYDFLLENGAIVVEIGGHTNSTPPDEFCERLSTARAKSVADYLVAKGIDTRRVAYKGYGKRKPIANNGTAEGRRQNQRVEIKILQVQKE